MVIYEIYDIYFILCFFMIVLSHGICRKRSCSVCEDDNTSGCQGPSREMAVTG